LERFHIASNPPGSGTGDFQHDSRRARVRGLSRAKPRRHQGHAPIGEQQENLKAWVAAALPRSTRQIGAWIEKEFGHVYAGRSGLIALLHRLGIKYHKPEFIRSKLDEEMQKAFIANYEKVLNSLLDDGAVLSADAVHPNHAARPAGCWAPKPGES
jgi:transposase